MQGELPGPQNHEDILAMECQQLHRFVKGGPPSPSVQTEPHSLSKVLPWQHTSLLCMLHMALLVLMSCVRQSHEEQYQQTKPNQTFIVLAVWTGALRQNNSNYLSQNLSFILTIIWSVSSYTGHGPPHPPVQTEPHSLSKVLPWQHTSLLCMLHMALLVLMSCVRQSHEEQYQQTKPNQTFIVLAVWTGALRQNNSNYLSQNLSFILTIIWSVSSYTGHGPPHPPVQTEPHSLSKVLPWQHTSLLWLHCMLHMALLVLMGCEIEVK